jgi:hypothetical protein
MFDNVTRLIIIPQLVFFNPYPSLLKFGLTYQWILLTAFPHHKVRPPFLLLWTGYQNMHTLSPSPTHTQQFVWHKCFLSKYFVYMACRNPLYVIRMSLLLAFFGRSYFGCKELISILVRPIIPKLMDKRKLSIEPWKCTCGVSRVQDPKNGRDGSHGHNFVITQVVTPQPRKLLLRWFMGESH